MNNDISVVKDLLKKLSLERFEKWSDWFRYCGNESELRGLIPDCPGVYQFRVRGWKFGRLRGETDIVYIGRTRKGKNSQGSLHNRIVKRDHTGAMKWIKNDGGEFDVRWLPLQSDVAAREVEQWALKNYIKAYWETPPGQRGEGGTDPASCEFIDIGEGLRWALCTNLTETLESAKTLVRDGAL